MQNQDTHTCKWYWCGEGDVAGGAWGPIVGRGVLRRNADPDADWVPNCWGISDNVGCDGGREMKKVAILAL
jgi:hypothetical protein